jgi:hypothetical protein
LAEGVKARGGSAEFILLGGAEHFHTVDQLRSRDGELFGAVARMMRLV